MAFPVQNLMIAFSKGNAVGVIKKMTMAAASCYVVVE